MADVPVSINECLYACLPSQKVFIDCFRHRFVAGSCKLKPLKEKTPFRGKRVRIISIRRSRAEEVEIYEG